MERSIEVDRTELVVQPLEEVHAREIVGWHYEPPYDLYDLGTDDVDQVVEDLLDPSNAYHAILTAAGELVAFCCFGPDGQVPGGNYGQEALDLGLGVRPDLTGRGQGTSYVRTVLAFAQRKFAPPGYRVTIAEFNARAQRVWARRDSGLSSALRARSAISPL